MALSIGYRLGPYEILAAIGAGGMGEVYRARDLTLKRDVALKVLPGEVARDPDRMARFQREAEVLAQLDHPNIAPIFGIVETDGSRALAMALVEGPTLADQIAIGPLPLDDALSISKQIIDALEYAHDRGVVHRDLKPANIKVTPEGVVKVLDFGLAKVLEDDPAKSSLGNSPTLTIGHTRAGMILGTAAYMSPEQAIGRPVDRRSDIFSFGCVLYEMLTGVKAFNGASTPDLLESVVKLDPDWAKLPAHAGRVEKLLRRCLVKDRKQRLQAIGEARIALETPETPAAPESGAGSQPRPKLANLGWIAAAVVAVALAVASWLAYRSAHSSDPKPLVRLNLDLPSSTFALSPDGTRIVYAQPAAKGALATRLLSESEATVLAGTEGAGYPFFSPDGQWIGFGAAGQLKKVSVRGGAPIPLTPSVALQGASWGKNSSIVASLNSASTLTMVADTGGHQEEAVSRADANGASGLYWPQYLPGDRAILFTAFGNAPGTYVKDFTTRKTQRILENVTYACYLATGESTGHLAYVSDGTLFARPFDPVKLAFLGPPQPVLSDVGVDGSGYPIWSASERGDFAYQMGRVGKQTWPVRWMDGSGATRPLLNKEGSYLAPRFSPDPEGRYLAMVKSDSPRGQTMGEVLVYDWKNDLTVTLTRPGQPGGDPVWSPDGKHLAISNSKGIAWVRVDGSNEPQQILEWKNPVVPASISPDGRYLAFHEYNPETSLDVWVAPLDLSQPDQPVVSKPESLVHGRGNELYPQFSPDGKLLSYTSDESGSYNVYVRPFPGPGAARNVSGRVPL